MIMRKETLQMMLLVLPDTEEEREKFEAIFEKYKNLMFTSINNIINDKYLAEDILQETFIKITNNIDKIDDDIHSTKAKNFIMTVTKNTALDYYRKSIKRREVEVSVDELEESVFYDSDEDLSSKIDTENRVISIFKNMKEKYRDIFLLKYVNELENDEIAKILNISEETVRKRISRGKKIIEEKLKGMGDK